MATGICPNNPSKVTYKIPEATEKIKEKFDTVLLEYLQANREFKALKGGKNQKFQIIPGKSVSTEAEIISTKHQGNSETGFNDTTAILSVIPVTIKKVAENYSDSNTQAPKVTLLLDVKFTNTKFIFRFLENVP